MGRQRQSYAWARLTDTSLVQLDALSADAREGLEYARQLADDARLRARQNVLPEQPFPPLTITDLAEANDKSPATVSRLIEKARQELFGNVSDAAIYKRRQ